ncbi:MAG: SDR family NAD(P)-dependent oxidoreductase, partial [Candidatus Tectomicrobia bacterium]|nr:SDR family NAD(P)-dependent oxidoreductase [Candidatus Tectomicrobia bacterium]
MRKAFRLSKHHAYLIRWGVRALYAGHRSRHHGCQARKDGHVNSIDLHGRTAVVTGAARGIGYGIAQRLLASGATVCLWDMDHSGVTAAAQACTSLGKVHTAVVNVTDPAAVDAGTQATLAACGRIDILVNNAGISGPNL